MSGRVIQGFFVGGAMRAAPGILRESPGRPGVPATALPGPRVPGAGATVQRAAAPGGGRLPGQPGPAFGGHGAPVQRAAAPGVARAGPPGPAFSGGAGAMAPAAGRGAAVQRSGGDGQFAVDPVRLGLARSGGSPLPGAVLAKMEAAFGADFSGVRVHIGPQAARIGAIAFTTGNDIYFAPGRYQPESLQGQQLLGHELAHVIQQRQGRVRTAGGGVAVVQDRALEAEADRLGMRAAMTRAPAAGAGAVQRKAAAPWRFPIQRMEQDLIACDECDDYEGTATGLAIHKGRKHKPKKRTRELSNNNNDDDEISDWEVDYESLDEDEEWKAFGGVGKNGSRTVKTLKRKYKSNGQWVSNQHLNYRNSRRELKNPFHSSKGLSEAISLLGGGNSPEANTHLLVSGPRNKNGGRKKRVLVQLSAINSTRAMIRRYHGEPLKAVGTLIKGKHVHAEMFLIWTLTQGDAGKVDGCMKGMHLVVDKPICTDCAKYVRRAGPAAVDDSTKSLADDSERETWPNWGNPFELKNLPSPPDNPFL